MGAATVAPVRIFAGQRAGGLGREPGLFEDLLDAAPIVDEVALGTGRAHFLPVDQLDPAHPEQAVARARTMTDGSSALIPVTADHGHTLTISGCPKRNPILGRVAAVLGGLTRDERGQPCATFGYANGPGWREATPNLNRRRCPSAEPSTAGCRAAGARNPGWRRRRRLRFGAGRCCGGRPHGAESAPRPVFRSLVRPSAEGLIDG